MGPDHVKTFCSEKMIKNLSGWNDGEKMERMRRRY